MKKILSIALVIVMMMAMSVNAFAATAGGETVEDLPYTTPDLDVIVRLDSDGDGTPDIDDPDPYTKSIIVEVSWTDMEFIYSKTWDGYEAETTGAWIDTDQFVTVTNRSNVGVTATFSYADNLDNTEDYTLDFSVRELTSATEDGAENVTENRISNATFENMVLTLANPADETVELGTDEEGNKIMPYADIAVNVSDDKVPAVDSKDVVGTITVTIAAEGTTDSGSDSGSDDTTVETVDSINLTDPSTSYSFTVAKETPISVTAEYSTYSQSMTITNVSCAEDNSIFAFDETAQTITFNTTGIYTVTMSASNNPDYVQGSGEEEPLTCSYSVSFTIVE